MGLKYMLDESQPSNPHHQRVTLNLGLHSLSSNKTDGILVDSFVHSDNMVQVGHARTRTPWKTSDHANRKGFDYPEEQRHKIESVSSMSLLNGFSYLRG
jgi:hypothetical protein